jgi:hypothetical protein
MAVRAGRSTSLHHLRLVYQPEVHVLVHTPRLSRLDIQRERRLANVEVAVLVEEILGCSRLAILTAIYQNWHVVVFNILEQREYSLEFLGTIFLVYELGRLDEDTLAVADV